MKSIPWAVIAYLLWSAQMAYAIGSVVWFTRKNSTRVFGWGVVNVFGALLCWAFVSAIIGAYEMSDFVASGAIWFPLLVGAIGAGLFVLAQRRMRRAA